MAMNNLNQSDQKQSGAARDQEVRSKPERRRFTAKYMRRIFKEVAACKDPGQIVALLRREGLYSSNLTNWRKKMTSGDPNALDPRKRGPKTDPLAIENAALRKLNQKLEEELKRAKIAIEVQKSLLPAGTADGGRAGRAMTRMQSITELSRILESRRRAVF